MVTSNVCLDVKSFSRKATKKILDKTRILFHYKAFLLENQSHVCKILNVWYLQNLTEAKTFEV